MMERFSYFFPKDKNFPVLKKKKKEGLQDKVNGNKSPYSGKTAYLTFDDGPSAQTPQVLDVLKRYNIKATFFVIGNDTPFGRQCYKRIVDEGHQLGIHSYTHDYRMIYSSVGNFVDDFLRMERLLTTTTGRVTNLNRFPGGSNNTVSHRYGGRGIMREIVAEINRRGYTHCDWNVDAGDATDALRQPDTILRNVLGQSTNKMNAIILMHDANYQKQTPLVLPQIIEGLQSQGFVYDVLSNKSFRIQFVT